MVYTATLENGVAVSWQVKHTLATWVNNPTPRFLLKWTEIYDLTKTCVHGYSVFIHNWEKLKTQMPFSR